MNKSILIVFILYHTFITAQEKREYITRVESILNPKLIVKRTNQSLYIVDDITNQIIENLDKKLINAKKLERDRYSITSNTVDFLSELKSLVNNELRELHKGVFEYGNFNYKSIFSNENPLVELFKKQGENELNLDKKKVSFGKAFFNIEPKSKTLFDRINTLKHNIGVDTTKTSPLEKFIVAFNTIYFSEIEKEEKQIQTQELKKFKEERHQFEFIDEKFRYNGKSLRTNQKLKDIEKIFGTQYTEMQKENNRQYRILQYKNIPLTIELEDTTIKRFSVHLKKKRNTPNQLIQTNFINVKNYILNKNLNSLNVKLLTDVKKDDGKDKSFTKKYKRLGLVIHIDAELEIYKVSFSGDTE
ncbi:hypothetical protein [Tenacibaculum agarivorans]|uniref:hypothetical protein n=1 Tax=Tenacibaculum agarivorans TaxID=1908389 RepID=UPI00117E388D|nr:hypothetical protein [Tenacibaculum agarivorans]